MGGINVGNSVDRLSATLEEFLSALSSFSLCVGCIVWTVTDLAAGSLCLVVGQSGCGTEAIILCSDHLSEEHLHRY